MLNILKNKDLIKEYRKQIRDKYPNMSLSELTGIIEAPFKVLKSCMQEDNLDSMRFKYFGVFKAHPGTVYSFLTTTKNSYKKGIITKYEYLRRKKLCNEYLNKINYEDKKVDSQECGSIFAG